MRLYHQSIGDLKDMMENVAYMSSPLMRANKHSEVLASDRNWRHQTRQYYTHNIYDKRHKKFLSLSVLRC